MSYQFISLQNISKTYGSKTILEDGHLYIHRGDKIALVGPNGVGKTTLLEIIAREREYDRGVYEQAKDLCMHYVPQHLPYSFEASTLFELFDSYWIEGLEQYDFDRKIGTFSGGEKRFILLCKSLMANPDLLLLDEPTNHLDEESLNYLQRKLKSFKGAVLFVSHDRTFIEETVSDIVELSEGSLHRYKGNYSSYLEQKERKKRKEVVEYEKNKREIKLLQKEIKATSFSKKKPSPPKDSNKMAWDKWGENHQKSTRRRLTQAKEQLYALQKETLKNPKKQQVRGFYFSPKQGVGKRLLSFHSLSKKGLFHNIQGHVCEGDRVLLKGDNGVGKTTLLRILLGLEKGYEGLIDIPSRVSLGYMRQDILSSTRTVREEVDMHEELLRKELHCLSLHKMIDYPLSGLSMGQRKKVMLLQLQLQNPHVLFLDEPTNHMDFETMHNLERALRDFSGAVIATSHDRWFIEHFQNRVWHLENGTLVEEKI